MSFSLSVGEFPLPRFSLPSSLKVRPCIKEMGEICQGLSNTSEGREAAKETDFCCSFFVGEPNEGEVSGKPWRGEEGKARGSEAIEKGHRRKEEK